MYRIASPMREVHDEASFWDFRDEYGQLAVPFTSRRGREHGRETPGRNRDLVGRYLEIAQVKNEEADNRKER